MSSATRGEVMLAVGGSEEPVELGWKFGLSLGLELGPGPWLAPGMVRRLLVGRVDDG